MKNESIKMTIWNVSMTLQYDMIYFIVTSDHNLALCTEWKISQLKIKISNAHEFESLQNETILIQ